MTLRPGGEVKINSIKKTMTRSFTIIFLLLYLFSSKTYPVGTSQTLYEQGLEAFKSGNYASSELLLRKIIESDNSEYKDSAWYYLALSILYQKKYDSARLEFNRFLISCTNIELCSLARYWIAESYYQQNDYTKSIYEFRRFISQSKNNEYTVKAYDRIGRIYFIQKRYDEAIIEWTKAMEKSTDKDRNNQQRLNIGEAYFLNNDYSEAIEFLRPLIDPKIDNRISSMAILITGRSYQIQGKNKTALKIFSEIDESLIGENPFNEVQYFRAISYIALGNLNLATIHLNSFLSASKDSIWIPNAKFELANIYLKENKINEATELFEYVRKYGNPALKSKAAMELSKIYFDNNIDESIKCLIEASEVESAEEKKEALLLLSKAYIKVNKLKEAENILEELLINYSYDKDIDSFYFLLGRVYLEENDLDKAIMTFDKVKQVNPFSKYIQESYYYLALAHLKNKNSEEAIKLFIKYTALKKVENKYNAYVHLIDLYTEKRDFKNADRIISIIIKYYSKEKGIEEVLFKYGKALEDNKKSGKKYFDLIVKRYNDTAVAGRVLLSLGDDAFIKKDFINAEKYYRQYLSVHWRQNAASVFLYHIISLDQLGKYKTIVSILESEDNIPPLDDYTSKQVKLWFGKSYYKTGEYQKACDSYSVWRLADLSEGDLLFLVKSLIKIEDIASAKRAAELIQMNKNLYAEALYEFSLYFISINDHYNAYYYLFKIIWEYSTSDFADTAKAEIAELYIKEEKYNEAIQKLKEIKDKNLQLRKNALFILSYFRSGNEKEAESLTKKFFKNLIKSPYGEIIIKENLLYYYKNKNRNEFNKYAQYLKKYPGNNSLINYLSGKLNFEIKRYKTSYYYFYKLSDIESEYKDEAIYYLGLISLLRNKNSSLAFKYFKKLSEENSPESEYVLKGKIELAILANERGNIELSKEILRDIINNNGNRLLRIQAENLIEYFGYNYQKKDSELNTGVK